MSEPRKAGEGGSASETRDAGTAAVGELLEALERLRADAAAYAQARWQLLRLELLEGRAALVRLAFLLGAAVVLGLVGLALLAAALAGPLAQWTGWEREPLWAIEGAVLLAAGASVAWSGWRRSRRELRLFEQSLEELQEDLRWLRERWGVVRR